MTSIYRVSQRADQSASGDYRVIVRWNNRRNLNPVRLSMVREGRVAYFVDLTLGLFFWAVERLTRNEAGTEFSLSYMVETVQENDEELVQLTVTDFAGPKTIWFDDQDLDGLEGVVLKIKSDLSEIEGDDVCDGLI